MVAAEKVTGGSAASTLVWQRYTEAPRAYPGVKEQLESLPPASLFEKASEYRPRSNRAEEERLERDLLELSAASPKDAVARINSLAAEHGERSTWVWATLGESPLALAIGHLQELAQLVGASGNPSTWEALADYYSSAGWKADRSVLRALDAARSVSATKAVTTAIRAIYLPWLERFSTLVQTLAAAYPTTGPQTCRKLPIEDGTVYLFADGLRMDVARGLEEKLSGSKLSVEIVFKPQWSALPTVTATAKPAWMPLAGLLGGPLDGAGFQSKERSTGKALGHPRFKQLLAEMGISFLESDELGLPTGCAWTEFGSVDTYGHEQGAKLAWRIEEELVCLEQRIAELLQAGWAKVSVTTDHGWVMVPGGLPKSELPKHLTASRWSRCAVPEPGAQHGYPMTSWFWDAAEAVVLAPGVSCFVAGMEYAHGGLSMQEALIPTLTISPRQSGGAKSVVLKEMKWIGMRLNVIFDGAESLAVDVRRQVASAASSLATHPTIGATDGVRITLLVEDDAALGAEAFLVVVDEAGQPVFKHPIIVGQG